MESVNYLILLPNTAPVLIFIFSHQNQPDMNKNLIRKTDILDIIFEKRNKLYGAYNLRKFYPGRLKLALGFMFIAAAAFSAFTFLPEKRKTALDRVYKKEEPTFTNIDETPKEKPKKPDVVKPQPKQAIVAQNQYLSNIAIVDKGVKTDSIKTLLPTDFIGTKTVVTPTPGVAFVEPDTPQPAIDGGEKSIPAIDKTLPMNGDAVDILPAYPGGMEALRKFLEKNLQTPTEMENGETVSVRVKFVVDYTGKLKSFVTVQDGGEVYNKEVVRVLKKMPDWVPGKTKGENVSVYYIIPVKFTNTD